MTKPRDDKYLKDLIKQVVDSCNRPDEIERQAALASFAHRWLYATLRAIHDANAYDPNATKALEILQKALGHMDFVWGILDEYYKKHISLDWTYDTDILTEILESEEDDIDARINTIADKETLH